MDMEVDDARFRAAVSGSWEAVWAIAKHLHLRGCSVQINPLRVRPTYEERADYGDTEDMFVRLPDKSLWLPIEVKGRNLSFSNRDDYPFSSIFVDRVEKADSTEPSAYFIVNESLTAAAHIKRSTMSSWKPAKYFDRRKGITFNVYACPVGLAEFFDICAS